MLDAEAPVAEVAAAPLADLIEDLPEAIAETTAEAPLAVLEDSQPEDTAEDAPPAGLAEAMALNANVEDAETLPEESSAALSDYDDDDAASLDDDDDAVSYTHLDVYKRQVLSMDSNKAGIMLAEGIVKRRASDDRCK